MSNLIRAAVPSDFPICAKLGLKFYEEGKLPGSMIPDKFVATWEMLFNVGIGVMFVIEQEGVVKGAIGGVIAPDPNDGELVASEMFWFIDPEARGGGLQLLKEFEQAAEKAGAKRIGMIHLLNLMPETLSKLYIRRGYKAIETHYLKELN